MKERLKETRVSRDTNNRDNELDWDAQEKWQFLKVRGSFFIFSLKINLSKLFWIERLRGEMIFWKWGKVFCFSILKS